MSKAKSAGRLVFKSLRRAWALPLRRKLLVLEALARLAAVWVCIRMLPYPAWKSMLGEPTPITPSMTVVNTDSRTIGNSQLGEVEWVHDRIERVTRGVFTCLMIALSARAMLSSRGISSLLILGVKLKDNSAGPGRRGIGAHAWLRCRGVVVVGHSQQQGHVPIAAFRQLGDPTDNVVAG